MPGSAPADDQPTIGQHGREEMRLRIDDEQQPGERGDAPVAMPNARTSRRSDPATISISPAAISSAPIMSDEIPSRPGACGAARQQDDHDARDAKGPRARPGPTLFDSAGSPPSTPSLQDANPNRRTWFHPRVTARLPAAPSCGSYSPAAARPARPRRRARRRAAAPALDPQPLDTFEPHHVVVARRRLNSARMLAAMSPRRVFLRMTITHNWPSSRLSRWPGAPMSSR